MRPWLGIAGLGIMFLVMTGCSTAPSNSAAGETPTVTRQTPTLENFNPYPFHSQSCGQEVNVLGGCVWDIGVMESLNNANGVLATQVGIVKGVAISWPKGGKVANASTNGRCSLVVLTPNSWFENLTIKDGNVTVYNVATGDIAGWTKTLAVQAAYEQQADYNCPAKKYEDIEQWGSPIPSPPCGTAGFTNCQQQGQSNAPAQNQQSQAQGTGSCVGTTVDCKQRMATVDNGGSLRFAAGDAVAGYTITIGGRSYPNCRFKSAPGAGTVSNGVVHPWVGQEWDKHRDC